MLGGHRAKSGFPGVVQIKGQSDLERHEDSSDPSGLLALALSLISSPGLRGRIKVTVSATTVERPRSAHFPEGRHFRIREGIAPPRNDLGGLRRRPRLDCRRRRRGLPGVALLRIDGSVGSSAW
jgi:hypothetical protein